MLIYVVRALPRTGFANEATISYHKTKEGAEKSVKEYEKYAEAHYLNVCVFVEEINVED